MTWWRTCRLMEDRAAFTPRVSTNSQPFLLQTSASHSCMFAALCAQSDADMPNSLLFLSDSHTDGLRIDFLTGPGSFSSRSASVLRSQLMVRY